MSSGNWKYKSDFGVYDIYKFYKKSQKDKKKAVNIDRPLYSKMLKQFNDAICKEIVENAYEYRMPFRLGYLRIRKHKTRIIIDADGKLKTSHLHPDWKATKELWENNEEAKESKKILWHTNKHTHGFYCKWYWDKRACNIRNSSVYSISISRTNKRRIAEAIKNSENIDYYE